MNWLSFGVVVLTGILCGKITFDFIVDIVKRIKDRKNKSAVENGLKGDNVK